MSVLDAVGSIARFCVKSVEEGFSEKADVIKDCQAEAKWYGNEEHLAVYQAAIRRYNKTRKERISGASGDTPRTQTQRPHLRQR